MHDCGSALFLSNFNKYRDNPQLQLSAQISSRRTSAEFDFAWEPIAYVRIPSHRISGDHVEFRVDLYICGAVASSAFRR